MTNEEKIKQIQKNISLDAWYVNEIVRIIGHALPHLQPQIDYVDQEYNQEVDKQEVLDQLVE